MLNISKLSVKTKLHVCIIHICNFPQGRLGNVLCGKVEANRNEPRQLFECAASLGIITVDGPVACSRHVHLLNI